LKPIPDDTKGRPAQDAFLESAEDAGDGPAIDGSAFNVVIEALGTTYCEEAHAKFGKKLYSRDTFFLGFLPSYVRRSNLKSFCSPSLSTGGIIPQDIEFSHEHKERP
jgi:hypothetical protein